MKGDRQSSPYRVTTHGEDFPRRPLHQKRHTPLVALHRIGNDGLLSDFHIRMLAPFRIDYRLPDGPGSWWCR